jgi:hypothetical protein
MRTLRQVQFGQDDASLHASLIDAEPLNNHHTVVYCEKIVSTFCRLVTPHQLLRARTSCECAGHVRQACAKVRSRLPRLATFIEGGMYRSAAVFDVPGFSSVRCQSGAPRAVSPRVAAAIHTDVIEDVLELCVGSNRLQEILAACSNVRGEGVEVIGLCRRVPLRTQLLLRGRRWDIRVAGDEVSRPVG